MAEINITMPRGDIRPVHFNVTDADGTPSAIQFDEIYFTVKLSYQNNEFVFQKRLSDSTIESDGEGGYQFTIESEDTNSLRIGTYVCDIELIYGNSIKQTTVGTLTLTNEVTFSTNEG